MDQKRSLNRSSPQLQLPPGFRFHPTDEELVVHYLARRAASRPFAVPIIAEVDIYKLDPWDLPDKALFGEHEWYFFSPRDRKYPNGARPNRAAGCGYWKATGTDKPITSDGSKVGVKKALVFYKGRAPKGLKTSWIMHEYRLIDAGGGVKSSFRKKGSLRLDDWVLCRIYKKHASEWKSSSTNSMTREEAAPMKMDADDESCLEEVLASLPDIDDSRICLPRLGSFTTMFSSENNNNNNTTTATTVTSSQLPDRTLAANGANGIGIGSNTSNCGRTLQANGAGSSSEVTSRTLAVANGANGIGSNISFQHGNDLSAYHRSDPVVLDNCVSDSSGNLPTLSLYNYDHVLEQKPAISPEQMFYRQQQQQQQQPLMIQQGIIQASNQSSCKQHNYPGKITNNVVNFPGYFFRHKS